MHNLVKLTTATPSSLVVAEEAGAACRESGLALWSPGSLWKQSKIMSATKKSVGNENISMNIRKCQKGGIKHAAHRQERDIIGLMQVVVNTGREVKKRSQAGS